MEITMEALTTALTKAAEEGATAAIKAANAVDPADRPAAKSIETPNVTRRRYGLPRLGVAMKAGYDGQWRQSQEFERDLSQATAEVFGYTKGNSDTNAKDPFIETFGAAKNSRSIYWPKTRQELAFVLQEMGEKASAKNVDLIDNAIKAMSEGTGSAGGYLVPTQYMQDQFEYALVSNIALRQVPGVRTLPTRSNVVALPRESTAAGADVAAEAGSLTAQDATLSQQTITIKKQYGYRQYSNELFNDADPAWMEFLANTLVRDVALKQDLQFIEGSGSGNNIQGIVGYSGLTTGPSLGTDGRSPTFDDFFQAQYLLRVANAEPDFVIAHPRVINSLQKAKDSTGNYILSNMGGYNMPRSFGTGLDGAPPKAFLIGALGTYYSSQINIARTVGASTDCTTVIVGQARYVVILERQGLEVAFSEHVAFANDQTAARCIGRAAVALTQPTAVTTIAGVRP